MKNSTEILKILQTHEFCNIKSIPEPCTTCEGTGRETLVMTCYPTGNCLPTKTRKCPECNGTGNGREIVLVFKPRLNED